MDGWFVKVGSVSKHCCFEYSICAPVYGSFDDNKEWPMVIAEILDGTEKQAHLIAAAPDLYDALVGADKFLQKLGHSLPQVKASLAKARGETT